MSLMIISILHANTHQIAVSQIMFQQLSAEEWLISPVIWVPSPLQVFLPPVFEVW